jgi:hypothetical protein
MKKITIKYNIEIPQELVDKVCNYCQCGRKDIEKDIKERAEKVGRQVIDDFISGSIIEQTNKGEE